MKLPALDAVRIAALALTLGLTGALLAPSNATAQQKFEIKNVAEKKLKQLPAGPLFWRVRELPDTRPGTGGCG